MACGRGRTACSPTCSPTCSSRGLPCCLHGGRNGQSASDDPSVPATDSSDDTPAFLPTFIISLAPPFLSTSYILHSATTYLVDELLGRRTQPPLCTSSSSTLYLPSQTLLGGRACSAWPPLMTWWRRTTSSVLPVWYRYRRAVIILSFTKQRPAEKSRNLFATRVLEFVPGIEYTIAILHDECGPAHH